MKILGKGLILRVGLLRFQNNWVSIICFTPKERGEGRGEREGLRVEERRGSEEEGRRERREEIEKQRKCKSLIKVSGCLEFQLVLNPFSLRSRFV